MEPTSRLINFWLKKNAAHLQCLFATTHHTPHHTTQHSTAQHTPHHTTPHHTTPHHTTPHHTTPHHTTPHHTKRSETKRNETRYHMTMRGGGHRAHVSRAKLDYFCSGPRIVGVGPLQHLVPTYAIISCQTEVLHQDLSRQHPFDTEELVNHVQCDKAAYDNMLQKTPKCS